MELLELSKEGLIKKDAFGVHQNETMLGMTKVLGDDIPFKMRMAIANYVMASFVSHFHTKIELEKDNLVPTNVISFVLAHSGSRKTSSVTKLEKSLQSGYDEINMYRNALNQIKARELDIEPPKLNPLSNVLSTEPGMITRLNEFKAEGLGLPSLFVDEISTELQTSVDIIPNIKLISQLFDSGDMKSKVIKDKERQSDEVHGMGMCGLFIGSEHGMLEDEIVLKKFEDEFISKLARRCFFTYPHFTNEVKTAVSLEELLESRARDKKEQDSHKESINKNSLRLAKELIKEDIRHVTVSKDAMFLHQTYEIYCEEMSKLEPLEPVMLETKHRFWKTLKLSAVYAMFNGRMEIEESDYLEALYCAEKGKKDLEKFAYRAGRQKYEIFYDHYIEGGAPLTAHDMVKRKLIKNSKDILNILELATSKADGLGFFEEKDGRIEFSKFEVTTLIGVSYTPTRNLQEMIDNGIDKTQAKQTIAMNDAVEGFKHMEVEFEKLPDLMKNDCAFTPFEFKDGHRNKDNLLGGANFIMLDVDDDGITDEECADLLCDFNYIIARTSDKTNPYKFRVLLPTDIKVEVDADSWLLMMKAVQDFIGFKIDILSKAQIFYGYKDREVIINDEADNFPISGLIKTLKKPKKIVKRSTSRAVLNDMYKNRKTIFWYAYEAKHQEANQIFNAMRQAYDMGFVYGDTMTMLEEIAEEMPGDLRKGFVEGTLTKQTRRLYGKD